MRKNGAASSAAFFSSSICGIVSIPLAVAYLIPEEMGLWTIVAQVVGYLTFLDFGVSNAVSRKLAEPINKNDWVEASKWWTMVQLILYAQALLVLLLGVCAYTLFFTIFEIPSTLEGDAIWLYFGCVLTVAVSMPTKAVPGLLTALDKFHWIPLSQAVLPWINVLIFWCFLSQGMGVLAYLISNGIVHLVIIAYYIYLRRRHAKSILMRLDGISMSRLRELFGMSFSLNAIGVVDSIQNSIPGIVISKLGGGLASVPMYTFTAKSSRLSGGLVRRGVNSFFPVLQKLYVSGNKVDFKAKFQTAGNTLLAASCIAGGGLILFNRTIVSIIAGDSFFAGVLLSSVLAATVVSLPMKELMISLVVISGEMRKSALSVVLSGVLMLLLSLVLYPALGMLSVALAFVCAPWLSVLYCASVASKLCGFTFRGLVGGLLLKASLLIASFVFSGYLLAIFSVDFRSLNIVERCVVLPTVFDCVAASVFIGVGGFYFMKKIFMENH